MKKILVCTNFRANPNNPSCAARNSKEILAELAQALKQKNIPIDATESPCMGFCNIGPNIHFVPGGLFLHGDAVKDLGKIVKETKRFLKEKNE